MVQVVLDLQVLNKKLMELAVDVESKTLYLAGLEKRLTSIDLEAGMDQLEEGRIYTKAVPPLFPVSPNKKLIISLE